MAKQATTRAAPRGNAAGWLPSLVLVLLVGPAAAQDRATHQAELDALFYDLAECEAAFDFRTSQRRR